MTLGAEAHTVVGMIALQGLKMTVLGLAIGTQLGLAAGLFCRLGA